jgi:ubiquinone/menaquinone biosynthesis C-methylase UbiE
VSSTDYHLKELKIALSPMDPRRVLPEIGLEAERVLDVGCGVGKTLIATEFGEKTQLWEIDTDKDALKFGRGLNKRIFFACAQGEKLPFRDRSFDLVISRVAMQFMDIPLVFKEFHRVLEKGGTIWIVLYSFKRSLQDLMNNVKRIEIKNIIISIYVICNGICFIFSNKLIKFPFNNKILESFQTKIGIKRILWKSGYENVSISNGEHFVVMAEKK